MDARRITKLRECFQSQNISGIYITNITNVRYLTGFTGSAGPYRSLQDKIINKLSDT